MDKEAPEQTQDEALDKATERAPEEKTDSMGKPKKVIKTSTGLIAIFAAAVIFIGGAFTYWYYNDPNSYDNSPDSTLVTRSNTNSNANSNTNARSNVNANTNSVQNMAGFLRFDITDLGIYFQYPEEWATASLKASRADTGASKTITFSGNDKMSVSYTSTDFTAGREGTFTEGMNLNPNIAKITNCTTFKADQNDTSITACEDVVASGKTIGMVVSYAFTSEEMLSGDYTVGYYFTGIVKNPVVGIQIQDGASANVTTFKTIVQSFGTI